MTTRSLPIKLEAERFQFPSNLAISKSRKPPHLSSNDDGEIFTLSRGRELRDTISLPASFQQFSRNIASDLERFRHRPALCN